VDAEGAQITERRLNLELGWRVTRQLAVVASHQFSFQSGNPGLDQGAAAEVTHNRFSLSIAAGSAAN
jgi:hypothetical protein